MGLFDFDITPQMMGMLGAAGNMAQAYAPQPASRLPLARPNAAYLLGQAASGMGEGFKTGKAMQGMQAQTQGMQIKNLNDALTYNLWAPYLGLKPLDLGGGGAPGPSATSPAAAPMQPMPTPGSAPNGALDPNMQFSEGGKTNTVGAIGGPVPTGGTPGALPQMPAPGAPPMPGGPPAASGGGGMDMRALYSLPPPLLQRMGITVPPELAAAYQADILPGTPAYQTLATNVALKVAGIQPTFGGDRPGVPLQQNKIDPATGQIATSIVPGSMEALAKGAFTHAQAQGQGGLASKEAESAFNAGLRVQTENEIAKRQSFYQTGVVPPDYANAQQPQMPVAVSEKGMVSPRGTVVPMPQKQTSFPGTDAIIKQNANTAETEKDFGTILPTLGQAESRMVMLGKAMQQVEGKGYNEHRAEISNNLRGAGLGTVADLIMKEGDVAKVKTALGAQVFDVLAQLKSSIGPGQRLLDSEFTNTLNKQYSSDLPNEANFNLLTQALGGIYQTRNMINDYYGLAKPAGERDANSYMSRWYEEPHNSMDKMTENAGKAIGPLKGMPGAPKEGEVRRIGKDAYVNKGGQWFPQ